MLADIILITTALVALTLASLTDIKTKEVPDYVSYSLTIIALSARLLYAIIYHDWQYFLYGLLGFGTMFLVGLGLYYSKQWGGGDSKLLMGLGAVFGTKPFFVEPQGLPFLLSLIVNLFFVGALYGLFWTGMLFIKQFNKVMNELKKMLKKSLKLQATLFVIITLLLISSMFLVPPLKKIVIFTTVSVVLYFYLYLIIRATEQCSLYKKVLIKDLKEGDWVAETIKINNKIVCSPKNIGLDKKMIEKLKRSRVKSVLVKEGIAFVPALLIGVIVSLIYGNIVLLLL